MVHILNIINNSSGVKNLVIKSLEKHKYCMTYYIIIHSDSFNLLAAGNKEGISMEYLDIKGQKTPTSDGEFTPKCDG